MEIKVLLDQLFQKASVGQWRLGLTSSNDYLVDSLDRLSKSNISTPESLCQPFGVEALNLMEE